MKPFAAITLVLSVLSAVSGQQRRRNGRQQQPALAYGAPPQQAAAAAPQASYGQTEVASDSASQGQHDHQGLDWLLESVPGTPGTDYPIYGQEALSSFQFDCNSQIEGGYYADPAADCQAFHVCIPDGLGGLGSQSFLCPNGTIFNQEYFICDWWFNFDCSNAQNLYSRNEDVQAEREQASQAQASNVNNNYSPSNNGGGSQSAQASYGVGK